MREVKDHTHSLVLRVTDNTLNWASLCAHACALPVLLNALLVSLSVFKFLTAERLCSPGGTFLLICLPCEVCAASQEQTDLSISLLRTSLCISSRDLARQLPAPRTNPRFLTTLTFWRLPGSKVAFHTSFLLYSKDAHEAVLGRLWVPPIHTATGDPLCFSISPPAVPAPNFL